MNPSDTLLKQIDLAAQYQKEHGDHSGILHDIKEGVKEVIDIVKGEDHDTHLNETFKVNETTASESIPKDNIQQFKSDNELRKETLGASV